MFRSIRRAAAGFLIAVLLLGSLPPMSAEAALKKPANLRFVQWNNTAYTAAAVAWKSVSGANMYQIRCTWTDGTHSNGGYVNGSYNGVNIKGLNYKHVYKVQVRALKVNSSARITSTSAWSNILYLTPWPKDVRGSLVGSYSLKLKWTTIYGSNGYNVYMSTNPGSSWYWNSSTAAKAGATTATVKKYRGSRLQKYKTYYVRVITRRKRNGVYYTVPGPKTTTPYYQYKFYIYTPDGAEA